MFWLIKAYIKRLGKSIVISFSIALLIFLILFLNWNFIVSKIPAYRTDTIGIAGVHTIDSLPPYVLNTLSRGLTKVANTGSIEADVASKWEVKDNGKTYIFTLKDNVYYSDGKKLDAFLINYDFADAKIEKPDSKTIVFRLKDTYSPFLVTVASHKIFKKGFVGVGDYKIKDIDLNGDFVQSIELSSIKEKRKIKFVFYPTQDALKTAFILGEVSQIYDINDLSFRKKTSLFSFKNASVSKKANYDRLVTVFYNNHDSVLSDKKIRKALSYSLPENFSSGERTNSPYNPKSWANAGYNMYEKDLEYSNLLLDESSASDSGKLSFVIKTLPQYESVAKEISKAWSEIGIKTNIEVVDGVPSNYQIFLGEFIVPKDPDQYMLWHSEQSTNITGYKNLRIDKLLEDGRKIVDINERKKIYSDFQKYLLDDQPAAFLFFPYTYTINRI